MKRALLVALTALCLGLNSLAFAGDLPTTYNVTMTTASTEYSQVLSPNLEKITLQCRTAHDVFIAFETGKVAGLTAPYYTLKSGHVLTFDNIATDLETITLYCACATSGRVIEVVVWR